MSRGGAVEIVEVPDGSRDGLEFILDESFEGLYLRHAKRTLKEIGVVRAARSPEGPVGVIMVKTLEEKTGYVYYVAVARTHRRKGLAALLLKDALEKFKADGLEDIYASVEEDNVPSARLFLSNGFVRASFAEVAKRFGTLRAVNMYRVMMVVPGEILLHKSI
ncbi:MAG: GNAT family N-acetyltransferase [Nitrososphaerota archaeon]|nr:GNAT family N-acetyltransferase [Nitrososphaerota archaeon]MDG7014242.1 GNAT family N-acetyltransferase [Nitrososphaerota archaeon]MDG7026456.1 GNAT family N-acetyltransferase [Nitrososphaerota archaeon]